MIRQYCIVAPLDVLQEKVNAPRELHPATGEELRPLFFAERTLLPSPEGDDIRAETTQSPHSAV